MNVQVAYKILTQAQFTALRDDKFEGAPVDVMDGYIHLSTASQLDETLAKHFPAQEGLVIVAIPLTPLGSALKWEASSGGQLFPHFYGRLSMDLVSAHAPLLRGVDGRALIPA